MTRYLLDTNILGNPNRPVPSNALLVWLERQQEEDLFISLLSVAEIRRGVEEKPVGKKRADLERWFAGPTGPQSVFAGRILPFEKEAALIRGRIMAEGTRIDQPRGPLDMIFAAVAEANNCILVTDNEKHFAGPQFMNPMRG